MKKLTTSVILTGAVLSTVVPSAFVQAEEKDPFAAANVATEAPAANTAKEAKAEAKLINTNTSLKENKIEVGAVNNTEKETSVSEVMSEMKVEKVGEDKVKVSVEFNSETIKSKSSKIIVKFPDVVTITDKDVMKGDLFDSLKTTVDKDTVTIETESVTAIPTKGVVFTATFNVKPATVKQDYPFTVDTENSSITNELNESVKLKTDGVKMIELATAAPVVEEAKKETGFEENVALATILGIAGLSFIASTRRKRSI